VAKDVKDVLLIWGYESQEPKEGNTLRGKE
jgi:hypothetical protein